jgi:hypothetical protein
VPELHRVERDDDVEARAAGRDGFGLSAKQFDASSADRLGVAAAGPGAAAPVTGRRQPRVRAALPLYGAALLFGATNAVYLSFAADRVAAGTT